jgi:hypothetical protein
MSGVGYRIHDSVGEVVPFNAKYGYPTQASKAWKSLAKLSPRNQGRWRIQANGSGSSARIDIDFPAQGYMNPQNSILYMDVALHSKNTDGALRLQNNAQACITRARWYYGSQPGEELREYGGLVRLITEGALAGNPYSMNQTAILEGIGGLSMVAKTGVVASGVVSDTEAAKVGSSLANARVTCIQAAGVSTGKYAPAGTVPVAASCVTDDRTRRYGLQPMFGLFQQGKLIPLKWMATQFRIELDLAPFLEVVAGEGYDPQEDYYEVSNVQYLIEIQEFDESYDKAIMAGLENEGLPIHFGSWNVYTNAPVAGDRQTVNIPERNRSLKALFHVLKPPVGVCSFFQDDTATPPKYEQKAGVSVPWDSHAMLQSSNGMTPTKYLGMPDPTGWVAEFQWRIGGKYYPGAPVNGGLTLANGGAEAYFEFAKAMNTVGNFNLSTVMTPNRWAPVGSDGLGISTVCDHDGLHTKDPNYALHFHGPTAFAIAANLETSNGAEISGLNGEEQNDIALTITYGPPGSTQCTQARYHTYVYYDNLMILRMNNIVEFIK